MSQEKKELFNSWLKDDGPAALVIREHLMPVEGSEGVLFPPTFAAGEGFPGGYNIDDFGNGKNICLIDSVGSQANRIEPMFSLDKYKNLVPQISIKAGDKAVSLLEAGHRAGDAIVRFSSIGSDIHTAFKEALKGNHLPLAKLAPTSLVFGVWDSRDTQAKLPRLLASTVRAFDVFKLTRSAQYIPAVDYKEEQLLEEPSDTAGKKAFAEHGFNHVPAAKSHGGVIAAGGIRRDATLQLSVLRTLSAGDDTEKLQRYILGLSLVAFTYPATGYLRQGCNLVLDPDKAREFQAVYSNGNRVSLSLTHEEALSFAKDAAENFQIEKGREASFDQKRAQDELKKDKKNKKGSK
jgi:CRISPR-associated protein Csb1